MENESVSFQSLHNDDELSLQADSDLPYLLIKCPHGIGSLVLERKQRWPDAMLFGLELSGLEGFSFEHDGASWRLEVLRDGHTITEPTIDSPLSLVAIENNNGKTTYKVRMDFGGNRFDKSMVKVSWVDFYR